MWGFKVGVGALGICVALTATGCSSEGPADLRSGTGGEPSGTAGAGGQNASGGTAGDPGSGGAGTGATGGDQTGECAIVECAGRVTACGDCLDNDEDGFADNDDPECLGPCDNYEGEELLTGVGGEAGEQCKADCYFDFGNGAGNDDCRWSRRCDPLEPKAQCTYEERLVGGRDCPLPTQSELCEDVCTPLTPNGCDCFGCCTFPELEGQGPGGTDGYVFIGSEEGCTFDTVTDTNRCKACTPASSCLNTCERCEICLGKPTIPDDCEPGDPGAPRCPADRQECGLDGDMACSSGEYCVTGCCTAIVVQ